jgi:lipase ATG15
MYSLLPTTIRILLSSFLWPKDSQITTSPSSPLTFSLRHEHGTDGSRIVFSNVVSSFAPTTYAVSTRHVDLHRPSSFSAFSKARWPSTSDIRLEPLKWHDIKVVGPDVDRRDTLLQLAKMTYNAYASGPGSSSEWYEIGPKWNTVRVFISFASGSKKSDRLLELSIWMGT